jgi:hypothetical protein
LTAWPGAANIGAVDVLTVELRSRISLTSRTRRQRLSKLRPWSVEQIDIIQQRMDNAFDNYFAMSIVLRDDLAEICKIKNEDQHWKRNLIRTSSALFEGYTNCLREMCVISFECRAPKLTKKETAALRFERKFSCEGTY